MADTQHLAHHQNDAEKDQNAPASDPQQDRTITAAAAFHAGPLPPPETLARYDRAVPGSAREIVDLMRDQAHHRMAVETKLVDSSVRTQARGQWMAFTLLGIVIAGGLAAVYLDKDVAGTVAAIAGVGSALALFFTRRSKTDSAAGDEE